MTTTTTMWRRAHGGLWVAVWSRFEACCRLGARGITGACCVLHHPFTPLYCYQSCVSVVGSCVTCSVACQGAKVAAYLSGHDHNLQHVVKLSDPQDDNSKPLWPQYVVSGAGSETRQDEKDKYSAKVGPASSLGENGSVQITHRCTGRQLLRAMCLLGVHRPKLCLSSALLLEAVAIGSCAVLALCACSFRHWYTPCRLYLAQAMHCTVDGFNSLRDSLASSAGGVCFQSV